MANQTAIASVVRYVRATAGVRWLSERDLNRAALIVNMFAEDIHGPSPDRWEDVEKEVSPCHVRCYVHLGQAKIL